MDADSDRAFAVRLGLDDQVRIIWNRVIDNGLFNFAASGRIRSERDSGLGRHQGRRELLAVLALEFQGYKDFPSYRNQPSVYHLELHVPHYGYLQR